MIPEDIPLKVYRWMNKKAEPFMIIVAPHIFGRRVFFDDNEEIVDEIYEAYMEIRRRRARKALKKIK